MCTSLHLRRLAGASLGSTGIRKGASATILGNSCDVFIFFIQAPEWLLAILMKFSYLSEKCGGAERNLSSMRTFRESMEDSGLQDLGFMGNPFTWCNKEENNLITECLDCAVANEEWRNLYKNAVVIHKDFFGSDHRVLQISLSKEDRSSQMTRRKTIFRFD
ncbi:hypothetical protein AXF42_Ash005534 [Apostasia shenzhenica]|uniref:Endonuclease/exonuclease/phosphatase domain-containing protein n=1 Tax=Apostasia shenzhenica TaxID=1088818 RepID=A0A2I0B774_9ASPA|nr:hypothetical protein AXF42_Ash005534 [Apostasia shenzhenica]